MRRRILTVLFAAAAAGTLAACQSNEPVKPAATPVTTQSPAPAGSPSITPVGSPSVDPKASASVPSDKLAALEGTWPGAGGTELKVARTGDKYKIEITGADKKVESFDGTAKGEAIEFTRKGKIETLKPATPEATGMKWTHGETTCVVVTKGTESYCKK